MDDKEIIEMLRRNDQNALRMIIEKYKNVGYSNAYSYFRGLKMADKYAEDVFIVSLEKLWYNKPNKPINNLKSYLLRIIYNTAIDELKKIKSQKRSDNNAVSIEECKYEDESYPLEDIIQNKEQIRIIYEYMQSEDELNKFIFNTLWRNEISIAEAARILNVSRQFIVYRRNKLREKIKSYLKERGYYYE